MKTVQIPRGPTPLEDGIVGPEGQIRMDTSRHEIRLHDGITPGGQRIPNLDTISELIATGAETVVGQVQIYDSEASLAAAPVSVDTLAIISQDGTDDAFVWRLSGDQGAIQSSVQGFWHRLDGQAGLMVRFWRAGLINLQVGGAAPGANQNITVWIDTGIVKMYDGTSYIAATPLLFARLMANVGSYITGSLTFPPRIDVTESDVADLNTPTDSGWYRSTAGASNSPVAGVNSFEHRAINATTAIQIFYVEGSATQDTYVRYKIASTWGGWNLVSGQLPARLAAVSSVVTDANNAVDSGFYQAASTATHIPSANNGVLITNRYSATAANQIWMRSGATEMWERQMTASTWSGWSQVYPIDPAGLANATNAATIKSTPVAADKVGYWDSVGLAWVAVTWANFLVALAGTFLKLAGGQTITGGFSITPNALGNIVSHTINPALGNLQWGTNHAAVTITAPASDCEVDYYVVNDATAGSWTFSGFTVKAVPGDPMTTTSTNKFWISFRRANGVSTYSIYALQ